MKKHFLVLRAYNIHLKFVVAISVVLLIAAVAHSHGGKGHPGSDFTPLRAVIKAVELYDQLVVQQKLDKAWETDLMQVNVSHHQETGDLRTVVSFQRSQGDPNKVYIFFNASGEYVGSNFSGD
jgi:hypothetical protein